ncbi:MFS transporter [Tomitella gaofuii]|uniref:MFS transporter n=1 Tax=Tomitella gaofuii TaxID=2760083 RepID=UPI0039A71611
MSAVEKELTGDPAPTAGNQCSAIRSRAYRKIGMRIIPLLFLSYVVNFLDRVNVGIAQLQMSEDLGFSAAVYGLGAGIFFIGYFCFEIPSNLLLRRFGARIWIARIMISWGVLSGLVMFTQTAWQFYLIRFLLGVAEAGFFAGVILYLTYWYTNARRARATAYFFTAVAVSGVVGGLVSGWILEALDGVGGLHGWQWMFLLEALPAVLLGIIVLGLLPSTPDQAKWLTDDEKEAVQGDLSTENSVKPVHSTWSGLKDGRVLLLSAIYFCFVLGSYGIAFWMPQIIRQAGATSLLEVGLLSAIPWGVAIVVMVLGSKSSDRTRKRRLHSGGAAVLGAAGLLIVVAAEDSLTATMIGLVVATAGVFTALPLFWSLPTSFLATGAAAVGLATINSIGNLGGFASNYIMGWITTATGSASWATVILAGTLLIGTLLMTRIPGHLTDK